MRIAIASIFVLAFTTIIVSSSVADTLPADEQAFFDKHVSDVITLSPKRLNDAATVKVFSAPIYEITITIQMGDNGTGSQKQTVARVENKLVPIARPGSDGDCPGIQKMISPDFKLMTDDDAKVLQAAMDIVFPTATDDEKKAVAFHHEKNEWTFIRGPFFDKKMGFVITTDEKGKITGVKYSLSLP